MSNFYASPGVYPTVQDNTTLVSNVPTSIAAVVGASNKGYVGIKLITDNVEFIQEYGNPVPGNHFHYSALGFLGSGNQLYCRRVVNGALYGGCAIAQSGGTNASFVTGYSAPEYAVDSNYPNAAFYVFAKDPGTWNNDLSVDIVLVDAVTYEFKIIVYGINAEGNRYAIPGETWIVSRKHQLDGFGSQEYLEDRINDFSKYILVADNTSVLDTILPQFGTVIDFASGSNGTAVIDDNTGRSLVIAAWNEFANPEEINVQILINAGWTDPTVQTAMKEVCITRNDCEAILDVAGSSTSSVSAMVAWRTGTQMIDSKFGTLYAPWIKILDTYNHMNVVTVPSGYIAAKWAYGDSIGNIWEAPAFDRVGSLPIIGTCDVNGNALVFKKADRDILYPAQINPLQTFPGQGTKIYGQKTLQMKDSDLSSINIAREVNAFIKSLTPYARSFMGKLNNSETRFLASAGVTEFCSLWAAGGAFNNETDAGFKVVCNTTNNTPAVISRKEMKIDIGIKPVHVVEFIPLTVTITALGVTFS